MTQMNLTLHKPSKTGVLRARCEQELESWYVRVALNQQIDVSDVVREALRDFKNRKTRRHGRV